MRDVIIYLMQNTPLILGGVAGISVLILLIWVGLANKKQPARLMDYEVQETRPAPGMNLGRSPRGKILLTMCIGDREKAERLIQYEMKRSPGGNVDSWVEDAISRWGRDLHRL